METPEGRLVQRLLDDIQSASRQVYFGTDGAFTCFSDGRFLERADSLPPAIDQLRCSFPNTLSTDAIRKMIPQDAGKSGEMPGSIGEDGRQYKLSCKKYTCVVDSVCYDYLKMRYPGQGSIVQAGINPWSFFRTRSCELCLCQSISRAMKRNRDTSHFLK